MHTIHINKKDYLEQPKPLLYYIGMFFAWLGSGLAFLVLMALIIFTIWVFFRG